jgi:hypothetical protein
MCLFIIIYFFTFVSHVFYNAHYDFFYYFSGKESFTVYTSNNISTYYMFHNKFNFELTLYSSNTEAYIEIFLMPSNSSVLSGDMYYIQLLKTYDYNYHNYPSRIQRITLRKCTSHHGNHIYIHGNLRSGCDSIENKVSISVNFKLWINLIFFLLEVMCPDKFIT